MMYLPQSLWNLATHGCKKKVKEIKEMKFMILVICIKTIKCQVHNTLMTWVKCKQQDKNEDKDRRNEVSSQQLQSLASHWPVDACSTVGWRWMVGQQDVQNPLSSLLSLVVFSDGWIDGHLENSLEVAN